MKTRVLSILILFLLITSVSIPVVSAKESIHEYGKIQKLARESPEKDVNLIYKFAYLLGIAFQIQDDYFDTFGDEHVFGKAIGGDILNDKKTWLLVDAFRMVTPARQPQFQGLLAMDSSRASEKIEGFKALYTDLGVKDRAQEAINAYYGQALELLNGSNLKETQKDTLRGWADMVVKRIK